MKTQKKMRFNLYDWLYKRDRKEDADGDRDAPRTFAFFFKLFARSFGRLCTLNMYFVLGCFPLWIILFLLTGSVGPSVEVPVSELFGPVMGAAALVEPSPTLNALLSVHGVLTSVSQITTVMWVVIGIAAALLCVVFGPVMTGLAINLRNIVRGEPLFLWSDFWYAVKSNWKQSIPLGIIDLVVLFMLGYGLVFYYMNLGLSTLFNTFFLFTIFLIVLYLFMRKYLYLMLVTFDLSVPKLFKNALIFSLIGLGRNFVSTLGAALVVGLNLLLMMLFFPLGILLPIVCTVGIVLFIDAYAAWPKIKAIMIDPYAGVQETGA